MKKKEVVKKGNLSFKITEYDPILTQNLSSYQVRNIKYLYIHVELKVNNNTLRSRFNYVPDRTVPQQREDAIKQGIKSIEQRIITGIQNAEIRIRRHTKAIDNINKKVSKYKKILKDNPDLALEYLLDSK